jgi:hypothetical protein
MTDRELLQMALEALEDAVDHLPKPNSTECASVAADICSRLAQPDLAKVGEVGVWGEQEHKYWCASLTQMLASLPPKPAPCDCKQK